MSIWSWWNYSDEEVNKRISDINEAMDKVSTDKNKNVRSTFSINGLIIKVKEACQENGNNPNEVFGQMCIHFVRIALYQDFFNIMKDHLVSGLRDKMGNFSGLNECEKLSCRNMQTYAKEVKSLMKLFSENNVDTVNDIEDALSSIKFQLVYYNTAMLSNMLYSEASEIQNNIQTYLTNKIMESAIAPSFMSKRDEVQNELKSLAEDMRDKN